MYAPVIVVMAELWAEPFASAFMSQAITPDSMRRVVKNQNTLLNEWGADIVGSNKSFFAETGFKFKGKKSDNNTQPEQKTPQDLNIQA